MDGGIEPERQENEESIRLKTEKTVLGSKIKDIQAEQQILHSTLSSEDTNK